MHAAGTQHLGCTICPKLFSACGFVRNEVRAGIEAKNPIILTEHPFSPLSSDHRIEPLFAKEMLRTQPFLNCEEKDSSLSCGTARNNSPPQMMSQMFCQLKPTKPQCHQGLCRCGACGSSFAKPNQLFAHDYQK